MIDELSEMTRSNPVTPEDLESAVSIDRAELISLLQADSGEQGRTPSFIGRPSATSAGYVGALVAAAAAVVVAVTLSTDGPESMVDIADPVEEMTPTTPLVVEDETTPNAPQVPNSAADQSSTTVDAQAAQTTTIERSAVDETDVPKQQPRTEGPFDRSLDLLVLHYDNANRDDGHATVAAREITAAFSVTPLVVSGTARAGFDGYQQPSEPVMQAAWGDQWLNALTDRDEALRQSTDRWVEVLDTGGRIWIAEGGVSDFTSEVLAEVKRARPGIETRTAIHVVQHATRNERESDPESLRIVMEATSYERIEDGNQQNETAGLKGSSERFEDAALSGQHGASWAAAFEYLPAAELDFSDTVEVLHILGIGTDEVADPDSFAERFLR